MAKKRNKIIGEQTGLASFASKKGRGRWSRISDLMIACMGSDEAIVLWANHKYYNMHRHSLWKDGTYYFSFAKCETMTGINTHRQRESYANLYKLSLLLKRDDIKAPRDTQARDINIPAAWIWSWLIYHHNEKDRQAYQREYGKQTKTPWLEQLITLRVFYKKALRSKKRRKLLRKFIQEMNQYSIDELDSGKHDERLLAFYDEFCSKGRNSVMPMS